MFNAHSVFYEPFNVQWGIQGFNTPGYESISLVDDSVFSLILHI